MAKHRIYLDKECELMVQRIAEKYSLEFLQSLRFLMKKGFASDSEASSSASLNQLLILCENFIPEVHFLAATTRSSLAGLSTQPMADGEAAAQKSRRYLASILQHIPAIPRDGIEP